MTLCDTTRRRGAGLVENLVIVALVAIFLVGAVGQLKGKLDETVQGSGHSVQHGVKDGMDAAAPTSSGVSADGITSDGDNPLRGKDGSGHEFVRDALSSPWRRSR